jgi:hypothetical protein
MSDTRITIRLTEEDAAWIKAQSDALGLDNEAAVVRMLVRQARLGNVSLSIVMQGIRTAEPPIDLPRIRTSLYTDFVPQPSVGDAYAEDAIPVADEVVDDMLASRLAELSAASPPTLAAVNGHHVEAAPVAISLKRAPERKARDYR